MTFTVRRLGHEDVAAYREVRLEGLRLEPMSFGSSLEEDAAIADSEWAARLARNFTFGVFDASELTGTATYYVEAGAKTKHRGHVVGVYLRPAARGTGAADLLMTALVESARQHVDFLYLVVAQSNGRAVRFYERIGFFVHGSDPGGLRIDGKVYPDYLMMLALKA